MQVHDRLLADEQELPTVQYHEALPMIDLVVELDLQMGSLQEAVILIEAEHVLQTEPMEHIQVCEVPMALRELDQALVKFPVQ